VANTVGIIGVGQMGRPIVDRLLAAGTHVVFFARRADVVTGVTAAGGEALPSVADVAAAADVLIVCMFSDAQVREVIVDTGAIGALRAGAVLVNHVTGSSTLAREIAASLPDGVGYLDAPMSGSADDISQGHLTLLVGGAADHLESVRPVLATYADPILHVGGIGDAQIVKLVNNVAFTVNLRMAGHVTELGEALGVDRAALVAAMHHCSGQSYALDILAHRPFTETGMGAGPYLRKDVAAARDAAAELGVGLGPLGDLASWVTD
jgi:3-hydroxyisobutyrate dehydrogenase-like beta-hydroxyacid dehydrogenase